MGITPLLAACQAVSSISHKAQPHILHEGAFDTEQANNPAVVETFELGVARPYVTTGLNVSVHPRCSSDFSQ